MFYACPECGLIFGREEGYFTGAMIVSYILGVPLLALLTLVIELLSGWRFDFVLLIAGIYFLPFVPAIFRYSRVIWMHFRELWGPEAGGDDAEDDRLGDAAVCRGRRSGIGPGAEQPVLSAAAGSVSSRSGACARSRWVTALLRHRRC